MPDVKADYNEEAGSDDDDGEGDEGEEVENDSDDSGPGYDTLAAPEDVTVSPASRAAYIDKLAAIIAKKDVADKARDRERVQEKHKKRRRWEKRQNLLARPQQGPMAVTLEGVEDSDGELEASDHESGQDSFTDQSESDEDVVRKRAFLVICELE